MKKICRKILRYLYYYSLSHITKPEYDVCILLNYWVYSKLHKVFPRRKHNFIIQILAKVQMLWNDVVYKHPYKYYYNICKPDMSITNEDWRKRKELYDNYVDYNDLRYLANLDQNKCTYDEKIEKILSLYGYFKDKCINNDHECPDVIKKYEEKDIVSELKKLSCQSKIDGRTVSIVENNFLSEHTEHANDLEDNLALDIASHITDVSNTQLVSENSGTGTKVTHTILGGAPVLLTASILYKVCIYFVTIYHYSTNL
ncbi:hypothetical protein PCYB_008010 [Plasmodium cynomolgi strain B]|uniref:CYIR protein n=1 Tax=Plasmodium cynomolgi (strain B) TaxID=1120755 RepID=K6VKT8_PLACD|nr:hypothetical protein PCYB_008010 [Plasmodium cynomolgi strain B]GAB70052.1 hypothetical protein PCYB_008010 [Plasmodium cynomolgi strain B]